MKIGFTGSRTWRDYETFKDIMDNFINCPDPDAFINGMCKNGLDKMALDYAKENNIKVIEIPADWTNLDIFQEGRREPVVVVSGRFGPYDKNAGRERNHDIVLQCDVLLSFCKNKSNGTMHCTDLALKTYNKPVIMFIIDEEDVIKEIKITRTVPTNILKTDNFKYINLVKDF